jgi:hypothetical protein
VAKLRWGGGLHSTHLPIIIQVSFRTSHRVVLGLGKRIGSRPPSPSVPPAVNEQHLACVGDAYSAHRLEDHSWKSASTQCAATLHLRTWPSNRVVVDKVAEVVVVARHGVGE